MNRNRIELISESPLDARVMLDGRLVGSVHQEMERWNYKHLPNQWYEVGPVDPEFRNAPNQVDQVPAYVRLNLQRMFDSQQIRA